MLTKDQIADRISTAGSFLVMVRKFPGTALLLGKDLFDLIEIAQKIWDGKTVTSAQVVKVAKATVQMCNMLG